MFLPFPRLCEVDQASSIILVYIFRALKKDQSTDCSPVHWEKLLWAVWRCQSCTYVTRFMSFTFFNSFRISLKRNPVKLFREHVFSMENTGQHGQADMPDVVENCVVPNGEALNLLKYNWIVCWLFPLHGPHRTCDVVQKDTCTISVE